MSLDVKEQFLRALIDRPLSQVASTWIIERVPYIFREAFDDFIDWKHELASNLNVDSSSIVLTGSSCVGISLNPNKNFKIFDSDSDVDVAVISDYYFNESWRYLRNSGKWVMNKKGPAARQAVLEHINKYIYWGTIATDRLLPHLPFGKQWQMALDAMSSFPITEGRKVKVRIYKDFESLRSYQINNLNDLRNIQIEKIQG